MDKKKAKNPWPFFYPLILFQIFLKTQKKVALQLEEKFIHFAFHYNLV